MMRTLSLAVCLALSLAACDPGTPPATPPAPVGFSTELVQMQDWEIYHTRYVSPRGYQKALVPPVE